MNGTIIDSSRPQGDKPHAFSNRIELILKQENALGVREIRSFKELEKAKMGGLTLVDFGAPWCAPCHMQEPILRRLAGQFKGKAFVAAVNIDESGDVASNLGIQSIPTLILFRNGKEIQRFVGLQSEATLTEALKKLIK